ncbi:hypothetical protein [Phenylobacterium sp.]|uniref:VgrG-related protein n=1 Tax=Phenylobacterium sp. TaxID=1871053 RepID=UPI0035B17F3B
MAPRTNQAGDALIDGLEPDFGGLAEAEESSHKGPATIGRQKKDKGGASYGTYQFFSKRGALGEFLRSSGYDAQFAGLTPDTPAFDATWVALADGDPEFGKAQKRYVLKTYYERPMERLRREGVDLSTRGRAAREAVFATSIQHGQNSELLAHALAGLDLKTATDRQIVDAIQTYKLDNVDKNFPNSADDQRRRIARDRTRLDAIVGAEELMALGIPLFP